MEGFALLFVLVCVLVAIFYKDRYDSTDHSKWDDLGALSSDAYITDVERKTVGTKGHRRFRTTVYFSDGFRYISHHTNVSNHTFTYKISLSKEDSIQILSRATDAHADAVDKAHKKLTS